MAYLATERHSTKPVGTPHYPHSILITSVSQPGTGRLDGRKDYPCHCRHRPSSLQRRQMSPRKPSLNGGRPAILSVPLFPEDFGLSSCPCSTLPQCRFRVLELPCLQVLRPAEALALSSGDSHPRQQVTKQGEVAYLPAVVICRCPVQPSDGFRCEAYADGTEILRFPESILFLVPCCRFHHPISVCERSAGLWML